MLEIPVKVSPKGNAYSVSVGDNMLPEIGLWAKNCLVQGVNSVAIVSNEKVFGLYGSVVVDSLRAEGFVVNKWLMDDGEEHKDFRSLQSLLAFLSENGITRVDSVMALGGGVVGDLAGFAASVYLRGISFLQVPTTFLAMIDASVGGKTAINLKNGKNLVGSFYNPAGVLVDVGTLKTLEDRDLAAGFYEAVKHGAIKGDDLLLDLNQFLDEYELTSFRGSFKNSEFVSKLTDLVAKNIEFKADIVQNDEKESIERSDSKSRKILNFGHTVAHALERVTKFQLLRHGEAVGYGILAASEVSKRLDLLDQSSLELLNDVVASVGGLPKVVGIDPVQIFDSFVFDKKMSGDNLDWILLKGVGRPVVVNSRDIPKKLILESIESVV